MKRTVAFILAGGVGKRLSLLTRFRAKPAVPFGGRYRIIDFTLTNCVRSGIDEVYILTQYISRSLIRHIGIGKAWDLDRATGGIHVLHPHLGYQAVDWYGGTADSLFQNISILRGMRADRVLILSGDHVYRMDYRGFIEFHERSKKPASVAVVRVPRALVSEFGIATVDARGRITGFQEKPKRSESDLASMGIYIFDKQFMVSLLKELKARHEDLDFGKHVIPHLVAKGLISAYRYDGYWLDIGTLKSYYRASLELLSARPRLRLYSHIDPVLTVPDDRPPSLVASEADIVGSLVCNGCVVRGAVHSSILSPGVQVAPGARVEGSIVFNDCVIGEGSRIRNAIIDKGVIIGRNARIGFGDASVPNCSQPGYLDFGVTLIGKRTGIPAGARIGANCLVGGSLDGGCIGAREIPDGENYIVEDART